MPKTKKEIIDETVAFYSEDPQGRRAYSHQHATCMYKDDSGNMCAVGRCLDPENTDPEAFEMLGDAETLFAEYHVSFKQEYQGHETTFWEDLQSFHDTELNFDPQGGLTPQGRSVVANLYAMWPEEDG